MQARGNGPVTQARIAKTAQGWSASVQRGDKIESREFKSSTEALRWIASQT
jgi:hypothetical protein